MKKKALQLGYSFPYLYDEAQKVALAYDVQCTPEFFVFDQNLEAIYHGQLDDSRPGNGKTCDGSSVREVLDHLEKGIKFNKPVNPSIGCSIKWK